MTAATDAHQTGVDVTVVCTPSHYAGDLSEVHRAFSDRLRASGRSAEFIYVIQGHRERLLSDLKRIREEAFPVRVLRLPRGFGEAVALQQAFDRARGRCILTIPDRFQIDPGIVPRILEALDEGVEVVLTRREPREDAWINRLQWRVFHLLANRGSPQRFRDLTCGLRGFTRDAARKLDLYGDLHRFIPILAARKGFRMTEIPGRQRPEDRPARVFSPGLYARRLLDILQILFITRFTLKPLRFFGVVGLGLAAIGFILAVVLVWERLRGQEPLSERPLLLLAVVLIAMGVQIISTGLLGELIIFFTSHRERPEVEEIPRGEG